MPVEWVDEGWLRQEMESSVSAQTILFKPCTTAF
jgi:hypothetical protein